MKRMRRGGPLLPGAALVLASALLAGCAPLGEPDPQGPEDLVLQEGGYVIPSSTRLIYEEEERFAVWLARPTALTADLCLIFVEASPTRATTTSCGQVGRYPLLAGAEQLTLVYDPLELDPESIASFPGEAEEVAPGLWVSE